MNFERGEQRLAVDRFFARKVAAFSVAVPLLFGASGCTAAENVHLPSIIVNDGNGEYYDMRCETIPEDTIGAAQKVFADSWVKSDPDRTSPPALTEIPLPEKRAAVAKALGLTVYDANAYYADLTQNLASGNTSEISTETYLNAATEFLSRYGVTLSFDSKEIDEGKFPGVTSFSRDELVVSDAVVIKQQLNGLIQSIGQLPVELVQYMGLKHVVLVHANNEIKAANGGEVAGFADISAPHADTIYVDPTELASELLPHEMFHLWDSHVCGGNGMGDDVQYAAENPAPTRKDTDSFYDAHKGYIGDDTAQKEISDDGLDIALQYAPTAADKAIVQKDIDAIESKVAVSIEYGFSNVEEDKATVGQVLLSQTSRYVIEDVNSPILQQKAMLLAARLYKYQPKFVEFLAEAGATDETQTNVLAK